MVFEPQELGISESTVKRKNIIVFMHFVLISFSVPTLSLPTLHINSHQVVWKNKKQKTKLFEILGKVCLSISLSYHTREHPRPIFQTPLSHFALTPNIWNFPFSLIWNLKTTTFLKKVSQTTIIVSHFQLIQSQDDRFNQRA